MTYFVQSFVQDFVGAAFSNYSPRLLSAKRVKFVVPCLIIPHVTLLHKSTGLTRVRYKFNGCFSLVWSFLIHIFCMLFIEAMDSCFHLVTSSLSPSNDPNFFISLDSSAFFFSLLSMVRSILSALI